MLATAAKLSWKPVSRIQFGWYASNTNAAAPRVLSGLPFFSNSCPIPKKVNMHALRITEAEPPAIRLKIHKTGITKMN